MTLAARTGICLVPALLLVVLAGCGEDSAGDPSAQTTPTEATEQSTAPADATADGAGGDFCATIAELQPHFGLVESGMTDEAQATADSAAAARSLLEDAQPPPELAQATADITAFYVAVDDAFAQVQITAGESTLTVLGDTSTDVGATVAPAVEGITAVENYAEVNCADAAEGTGTEVADLCAVLSPADLARVFGDDIPELDDQSFGPEAQGCVWEVEDGPTVSLMLITREEFQTQFLDPSAAPQSTVDGIENGEVHKGIFGLGGFDTRGSSVYFTTPEHGGIASVRTGADDNFVADDPIAIDFAKQVVDAVS